MKKRHFDARTLVVFIVATFAGVAWAYYNYTSTGGDRGESQLRPLVWTIFSTPFVLFLGWLLVRRAELWLAAFVCFCCYFFTPFVAATIESWIVSQEVAAHMGHHIYFSTVMILHSVEGISISIWRAMTPYPPLVADTPKEANGALQENSNVNATPHV